MRRTITAVALTAALAASMVALSAGPATAGAGPCEGTLESAPDGRVRAQGESFVGGGSVTPLALYLGGGLAPGDRRTFEVQFKNNEAGAETIRLKKATSVIPADVRVKVFVNGENKTSSFGNEVGGLSFQNIASGKRTPIVEFRFRNVGSGTPTTRLITFGHYKGESPLQCDGIGVSLNDL